MVGSSQKNSVLDILYSTDRDPHTSARKTRTTNSGKKQSTKSTRALSRNAKYPDMADRMANQERHGGDTDDGG